MASPYLHVKATRRVFPATPSQSPVTSKLSIIDATAGRFSPCAFICLYEKPATVSSEDLVTRLEQTLSQTLDDYRHFAGQIRWATEEDVKGDLNMRALGRPVVDYGMPDDPGAELVIAQNERPLAAIVPDWEIRSSTQKVWNATDFQQSDFLAATPVALVGLSLLKGQPSMLVQLTTFQCGGFAVGIKVTHCLSDAITLLHFVHAWAARSRAPPGLDVVPDMVRPIFDPSLLDRAAGLTADGTPDGALIARARALPMHRYDWWAFDSPKCPDWVAPASKSTMPPPDELARMQLSPATPPPWPTWDRPAPVQHVQIRFSADEVARMKQAAQATLPEGLEGVTVSRQDAALAHIWILINRARQFQTFEGPVYLEMSIGLRSRLDPPLPDNFVGSLTVMPYVCKTGAEASTSALGIIAASIRQTLTLITPDAVAAHLHDAAHEVSPQRLWQGFLGERHTMVTSWARARAYDVDFVGGGRRARYVQGVVSRLDGLVQIIDVGDTGDLDFSVCLKTDVMERLVKDPLLRTYES